MAIAGVCLLAFSGAFQMVGRAVQTHKYRTIATVLASEKVEVLKNYDYYRLMATSAATVDPDFSALLYDPGYYPPEVPLYVGGIAFDRRVFVEKLSSTFTALSWSNADAGVKRIRVYVKWTQGNEDRYIDIYGLKTNPKRSTLNVTLTGTVQSGAVNLSNANVAVVENPAWSAVTDISGAFSIGATTGTWTVRATKTGYFPNSTTVSAPDAGSVSAGAINLTAMGKATVLAYPVAWPRPVISQMVSATATCAGPLGIVGVSQEFVELYNPTTYAYTINDMSLVTKGEGAAWSPATRTLNVGTMTIASNAFYLLANCSPLMVGATTLTPNTVWESANIGGQTNFIPDGAQGAGIQLKAGSTVLDRAGWDYNSGGQNPDPDYYEGTPIRISGGLDTNETLIRYSMVFETFTVLTADRYGHAFDSSNNKNDFYNQSNAVKNFGEWCADFSVHCVRTSSNTIIPMGGTPLAGATASLNDGLSGASLAASAGSLGAIRFSVVNVATGTWVLQIASSTLYNEYALSVLADGASYYPSTQPNAANFNVIYATNTTTKGTISGRVTNVSNNSLSTIRVDNDQGIVTYTDSMGNYRLTVDSGTYGTIVANRSNENSSYIESRSTPVVVSLGQVTSGIDFALVQGGVIRGLVSTNGVDPLPGVVILATKGGTERGSAASDTDGIYKITNISTTSASDPYLVYPVLDAIESATPASSSLSLSLGEIKYASFTVSSSWGYLEGDVTNNGAKITTGILLVATTSTISAVPSPGYPPDFYEGMTSLRGYSTSSNSDGRYKLAVRGGYTYNLYGYYTTFSGVTPTTTRKSSTTATTVGIGQTETATLAWP